MGSGVVVVVAAVLLLLGPVGVLSRRRDAYLQLLKAAERLEEEEEEQREQFYTGANDRCVLISTGTRCCGMPGSASSSSGGGWKGLYVSDCGGTASSSAGCSSGKGCTAGGWPYQCPLRDGSAQHDEPACCGGHVFCEGATGSGPIPLILPLSSEHNNVAFDCQTKDGTLANLKQNIIFGLGGFRTAHAVIGMRLARAETPYKAKTTTRTSTKWTKKDREYHPYSRNAHSPPRYPHLPPKAVGLLEEEQDPQWYDPTKASTGTNSRCVEIPVGTKCCGMSGSGTATSTTSWKETYITACGAAVLADKGRLCQGKGCTGRGWLYRCPMIDDNTNSHHDAPACVGGHAFCQSGSGGPIPVIVPLSSSHNVPNTVNDCLENPARPGEIDFSLSGYTTAHAVIGMRLQK